MTNRLYSSLDENWGAGHREYRLPKQMADFHQLADGLSKRTYQERVLREGFINRAGSYEDLQELAKFDAVRGYVLQRWASDRICVLSMLFGYVTI